MMDPPPPKHENLRQGTFISAKGLSEIFEKKEVGPAGPLKDDEDLVI